MTIDAQEPRAWWKKLGWFVGLWVASVLVVGAVAYFIRFWIS
jgi:hypothetical protein